MTEHEAGKKKEESECYLEKKIERRQKVKDKKK
jgi:hypothetical protein